MRNKKRLINLVLLSLFLTSCGNQTSSSTQSSSSASSSSLSSLISSSSEISTTVKVDDVLKQLVYSAQKYNPYITASSLLGQCGFHGNEELNNTNAAIILYYAFKDTMKEKIGARNCEGNIITMPKNVPDSAKEAVAFFISKGIYVPKAEDETDFHGDTAITTTYFNTLIDRIHAYNGTSLKDDFFSYTNHDELYDEPSRLSWAPDSLNYCSNIGSMDNLKSWIENMLIKRDDNAALKSAKAFYSTYIDENTRDDTSKGVLAVLKDINSASDETALMSKIETLSTAQCFDPLFAKQEINEIEETDNQNTTGYKLEGMNLDQYAKTDLSPSSIVNHGLNSSYESLYSILGFSSEDSASLASAMVLNVIQIVAEAKKIVAGGVAPATDVVKDRTYGTSFNLFNHLVAAGYDFLNTSTTYCPITLSTPLWTVATLNAIFGTDSTLAMKKAYLIYQEANHYLPALPYDAMSTFIPIAGSPENMLEVAHFYTYLMPAISDPLTSYYSTTESYANNVAVCNKIIENTVATLKERINVSSWLSSDGKAASIRKVEKMRHSVFLETGEDKKLAVEVPSYVAASDGGNLYSNMVLSDKAVRAKNLQYIGEKETLEGINAFMPQLTPNAFYSMGANSFTILTGFLASNSNTFDKMDSNTLAGNLGWTVGHEISHGFDTSGTLFDENGKYATTWWSEADHAAYDKIKNKAEALYENQETLPGLSQTASKTISEAIADIGGVSISYYTASKNADFDAKAFFAAGAKTFMMMSSRAIFMAAYFNDVHPYGRVRVNRVFASFTPFEETYDIQPLDFMYVAPSDRITLW
jgi:putative endopeptidase